MKTIDKVELIREKTGVSYEDAKAALDANDGDVLDAIIWLERAGKTQQRTAHSTTSSAKSADEPTMSAEMVEAQVVYEHSARKGHIVNDLESFFQWCKRVLRRSIEVKFVAERNGERVITAPVLVLVLGLFFWGATLWLLIIGLFVGMRYHLEGVDRVTVNVNEMMDKAADVAETIKRDVTTDE